MSEEINKVGRPTLYTEEIAEEICEAIATTSFGLRKLCYVNSHWPGMRTIRTWRRENEKFQHMYAIAKQDQADYIAEECMDIADDDSRDTLIKINKDGSESEVCNTEWIARSRLRVDTRKWMASKLLPRVYGEKVQVESTKDNDEINVARGIVQNARSKRVK